MPEKLRILILEDNPTDAELIQRKLRSAGITFSARRVVAKDDFVRELEESSPGLILSDYTLRSFDGIVAMSLARETCPDVPFIFVSGAIGEELAIKSLKEGATDYVLKDRLARLVPSVRRALREAEDRAARRRAESAKEEQEARLQAILGATADVILATDEKGTMALINPAVHRLFGYEPEELVGKNVSILAPSPDREGHEGYVERYLSTGEARILGRERELEGQRKDGTTFPMALRVTETVYNGERMFIGTVQDITERKRAEDELRKAHDELAHRVIEIGELKARLERENVYLREEIRGDHNFEQIVGQSAEIKDVLKQIETVAPTGATVLIHGETGTGKELVARAVHNLSPLKNEPLVKVDCAALAAGVIESELFGHEKGAFTGAVSRKIGRFELADGGTIFLDEIGDLPLELQANLLRVLEEGEFERVGGSATIKVDVRVIAATNRQLDREVQKNRFRSDLYYRLNVFPIRVPPLRERQKDIPLLVRHFVTKCGRKLGKEIETITAEAMAQLLAYEWPGNVRELVNVIERAVILWEAGAIAYVDLPKMVTTPVTTAEIATGDRRLSLGEVEKRHILSVFEANKGNKARTARELGIDPKTLYKRLRNYGILSPKD